VPGHERFVRNMVAGVCGIDFALLVVAADDGVMPQTVEHVQILDLLGVRRGLAVMTKVDRVDAARRPQVRAQSRRCSHGTALQGLEVVEASPVTGEGIEAVAARCAPPPRRRRRAGARPPLPLRRRPRLHRRRQRHGGDRHRVQTARRHVGDRLLVSPGGWPPACAACT
jgi:selenocysteine-specific elongation factor